jgi:hypothetical protein
VTMHYLITSWVLGFWIFSSVISSTIFASEKSNYASRGSQTKAMSRILIGNCELMHDPLTEPPNAPVFCLRGKIGGEYVLGLNKGAPNYWGSYTDGSLGIYITSWFSLYGRARARNFMNLGLPSPPNIYADAEYAVGQFGNPVMHKVRLMLGQMRPPFGIDRPDVDEFYRLVEDRRFWPGPATSAILAFDDLRATELDIGWAGYTAEHQAEGSQKIESFHQIVSARFMRDLAGNGSTRLVFSGALDSLGPRYYGFGVVNVSQNTDQFVFEVVRRQETPDGRSSTKEAVNEVIRLGYIGTFVQDSRWIIHFDDERSRFRRGLVELNQRYWNYLIVRLGFSYKIESMPHSKGNWHLISGVEGRI